MHNSNIINAFITELVFVHNLTYLLHVPRILHKEHSMHLHDDNSLTTIRYININIYLDFLCRCRGYEVGDYLLRIDTV
jgi:hypothetical protein